jgi:hypothetical protein
MMYLHSFVVLFSWGSNPGFHEPLGTESAVSRGLAVFQKGFVKSKMFRPPWNSPGEQPDFAYRLRKFSDASPRHLTRIKNEAGRNGFYLSTKK